MGNEDAPFIFGLVKISLVSLVSDLFKFEVLKIFPLNLVEKVEKSRNSKANH